MTPPTPSSSDVTLGEVARSLQLMREDISGLRDVVVKRDDLTAAASSWQMLLQAHEQFSAQRYAQLEHRVASIEGWQTWAMRIVLGIVVAAVVGVVIVQP